MIKKNIYGHILRFGAGLIILSVILLPMVIIPFLIIDKTGTTTPESAIFGCVFVVILHLLILYGFREAIIVSKRDGHLNIAVFIFSGIVLLLLGLVILDAAVEFLGYYHFYLAAIALFVSIARDFFAAVIAFVSIYMQPKKKLV
jgi:hypothetical protein